MSTTSTPEDLNNTIDQLNTRLSVLPADSTEAAKIGDILAKLYKLRDEQSPEKFSKNTMLTAGANLLGIAMILHHERAGVVASKALGFVMKLK